MKKPPLYCVRCWQITGAFVTGHATTTCESPVKMTKSQILKRYKR